MTIEDKVKTIIGEQTLTILALQAKVEELELQIKESKKSK